MHYIVEGFAEMGHWTKYSLENTQLNDGDPARGSTLGILCDATGKSKLTMLLSIYSSWVLFSFSASICSGQATRDESALRHWYLG